MSVPPDDSKLYDHVEMFLNASSSIGVFCERDCKTPVQAEKSSKLSNAAETDFFIVILSRAVETIDGYQFVRNRTKPTYDVFIRYIQAQKL